MTRFAPPEPVRRKSLQRCAFTRRTRVSSRAGSGRRDHVRRIRQQLYGLNKARARTTSSSRQAVGRDRRNHRIGRATIRADRQILWELLTLAPRSGRDEHAESDRNRVRPLLHQRRILHMRQFSLVFAIVIGSALLSGQSRSGRTLEIYVIDVEGGNATLFVSPSGQSLLVDAGNLVGATRDADRIMAAVGDAGLN